MRLCTSAVAMQRHWLLAWEARTSDDYVVANTTAIVWTVVFAVGGAGLDLVSRCRIEADEDVQVSTDRGAVLARGRYAPAVLHWRVGWVRLHHA